MKKLPVLFFLAVSIAAGTPALAAESAPQASHTQKKPATKKAASSKKRAAAANKDDQTPDISASQPVEYDCELGNKLTVYRQADNDQQITVRWKKRLLRFERVPTTTGANRFENRKNGLVWIDIPAKGMLLDAKKGRQLANECRNADQLKAQAM
ncbi:hypothetical protein [Noviherbaspirillum massiliense]|uniref:hypothetical protein n=1 Tax=Noviherbaspirillum massiliense TaxID=1465823 RepID=UPI00031DB196|nr:hypothetical protein [Noviherbaspirillum massiliense]